MHASDHNGSSNDNKNTKRRRQIVCSNDCITSGQAQFVAHLDEDRRRFSRIERELEEIKALLLQHGEILKKHEQILRDLPEVIRQKIGFKPQ